MRPRPSRTRGPPRPRDGPRDPWHLKGGRRRPRIPARSRYWTARQVARRPSRPRGRRTPPSRGAKVPGGARHPPPRWSRATRGPKTSPHGRDPRGVLAGGPWETGGARPGNMTRTQPMPPDMPHGRGAPIPLASGTLPVRRGGSAGGRPPHAATRGGSVSGGGRGRDDVAPTTRAPPKNSPA